MIRVGFCVGESAAKIQTNRIAEVAIQHGELYCMLCEEKDCVHIGYVFALPDVYEILNSKGIKNPK